MDLLAAVDADAPLLLAPGAWIAVPTGLAIALPEGFEAQVRPRSGLALKIRRHGAERAGNGGCGLSRRGEGAAQQSRRAPFEISRGMRVAQLVVAPVRE